MAHHPQPPRSRREVARTAAVAVLAVLVALFAILNRDKVEVDWILGSGHAPLIVVIAISLLAGVVLTWLGERVATRRRSRLRR